MKLIVSTVLTLLLVPLRVWCQTVQDAWTAPAAPDGSTPLQAGTKFTLLWKSTLRKNFEPYCPSCDTKKLDLWITNFNGTRYQSKIGRGLDLTTTLSYDWNVQIASSAFSEKDFWVFRFTYFDSEDPYSQQISSPGFRISGLVKALSTAPTQSSSASSVSTSSSFGSSNTVPTSATSAASSTSSTPKATEQTTDTSPASKSNVWVAGVVVGPIVGIALGAALMWFCLRKRKNKKAQQSQQALRENQDGWHQQYPPGQAPVEKYSHAVKHDPQQPWQQQLGGYEQHVAEAPGNTSPVQPAELWHGNYRS